ncbi:GntR family transcriptional regulator [Paenibacillus nuruki]|uniref:GntR family transcriptional regulator n=1 Tax=Paenibacillus nuruki TaxID=1886670 RepID=UPI0028055268|nr:GntR family transcriptional regulator [Paenibacillus nuruki]CAJ1315465.1 GntR family transcriptional regulator [Paenibacillus nuruki]
MSAKQETIKSRIEQWITEHNIHAGDKLPSESKLATQFKVCRTTVRGAIRKLQDEGKLVVKHGSGTFLTQALQHIPSSLDRLYSIGDMIRSAGLIEDQRLAYIILEKCPPEVAERMELSVDEPMIVLERSRMANGEIVAHSINYMPVQLVGNTFDESVFTGSLFQHLEQQVGIEIVGADSELTVPLATDPHSRKLLVHPQSSVLLLKQTHYDEMNRKILYSYDYVRSDIFTFWIRRTR